MTWNHSCESDVRLYQGQPHEIIPPKKKMVSLAQFYVRYQKNNNFMLDKFRATDFLISMYNIAGMQVLGGPEKLVHDILFVHFFQDISPFDDVVQVRI